MDKTALEQIREALEVASKELDCCDWGEIDLNGEGAMGYYSHDIVRFPEGCPSCKVKAALPLLKSMEGQEPRLTVEEVMNIWQPFIQGLNLGFGLFNEIMVSFRARLTKAAKP